MISKRSSDCQGSHINILDTSGSRSVLQLTKEEQYPLVIKFKILNEGKEYQRSLEDL